MRELQEKHHAPELADVRYLERKTKFGGVVKLAYTSHATVTKLLNTLDPFWRLDPIADDRGVPIVEERNGMLTMWAKMTVHGRVVTCCGSCDADKADWAKELLGDAIRRGAMMFGIHIDLWLGDFAEQPLPPPDPAKQAAALAQYAKSDVAHSDAVAAVQKHLGGVVVSDKSDSPRCGVQPLTFAKRPAVAGCGAPVPDVPEQRARLIQVGTYLCGGCFQHFIEHDQDKKQDKKEEDK